MRAPRRPIPQPRHRDPQQQLPGFNVALRPQPHEWNVDKLHIGVVGTWSSAEIGRAFFERSFTDPFTGWLTAPHSGGSRISVKTREGAATTLRFATLFATSLNGHAGRVEGHILCNPTRTLESLLARYGGDADFRGRIEALDIPDFFASHGGERSLDKNDNWIRSPGLARDALGPDISAAFLPLFVDRLQAAVMSVLAENLDGVHVDGGEQVWRDRHDEIRLRWNKATAPQVETYFERYHSRAIEAVRMAGMALLDRDHRNTLRRVSSLEFEREADCFSISLQLVGGRRLAVYAKTPTRLRFEVRRSKRGRYPSPTQPEHPADRLLSILAHEQSQAERVCRWEDVGAQFGEPDQPTTGDLTELFRAVLEACGVEDVIAPLVLKRLLADGGLSPELVADLPSNVVSRLKGSVVIDRTRVRTRDLTGSAPRLALTEHFDLVRQHLLRVFPPDTENCD